MPDTQEENITALLWHLSNLFGAHQASCDDCTVAAFEALHALGYFAGSIIAQAEDAETQMKAKGVLLQAINDALLSAHATRH